MKINPITNPNVIRSYQAAKPAPAKSKLEGGRDEVTFSEEALNFAKAMTGARDSIELRSPEEKARLAEITLQVRQGTYRVDSGAIADRILESVLGGR